MTDKFHFEKSDIVILTKDIKREGYQLNKGLEGKIVHAYKGLLSYEVEFSQIDNGIVVGFYYDELDLMSRVDVFSKEEKK